MSDLMKLCSTCATEKPASEFYKNGARLHSHCKSCHRAKVASRYLEKKDEILEQQSRHRKANPEKFREKTRAYYENNLDAIKAWKREYVKNNRQHIADKKRENYIANREQILAKSHEYWVRNRDRVLARARVRYDEFTDVFIARSAARRAKTERATPEWDRDLTSFCFSEAVDLCRKRKSLVGGEWHVDHIIPIVGKRVCGLHVWNNFAVVPARFNLSKQNKVGEKWMTRSWL